MKISITIIILVLGMIYIAKANEKNFLLIGMDAPDFSLFSTENKMVSLSDFRGKNIVLYFFPKSDTPGWKKQACGFRDIYDQYKNNNIVVIGVSYDAPSSLLKFKNKHKLPFYLLSDKDKIVSKLYGANGFFFPQRMTFYIGKNGKIYNIYKKINLNTHATEILKSIIDNKKKPKKSY